MKKALLLLFLFATALLQAQTKDTTRTFNKVKQLANVVVTNKKPFVEMQADKVVLNVQNDIIATGGTLFEILQRAPGVSITNDEIINLAGKDGVNLLIDGRPTQLSAKDLADYLKSTPGAVVDKIEIIMNPSAKYDAQGNAGIINIRLKKNMIKGTNGNLSTAYTQSIHPNFNISSNLNHRRGKWNWYANIAGRQSRQNTTGAIKRFVNSNGVQKIFENRTVDQDRSRNMSFQAGADFFVNNKSTFGLMIKGNEYRSKLYTPGTTMIKTNNTTDSSLATINDNRQQNSRYNFNLNYKYEDTTGTELNLDADYTTFKNNSEGLVTTDLLNSQQIKYGYTANDQDVATTIQIASMKADLNRSIKKWKAKIQTGLKWNTIQTNNDLAAFNWQINQLIADTGRTNRFDYTETTYAGYASFTQSVKKWEYQLGLRAEHSVLKGNSTDLKKNTLNYPDTNYLSLFPSAFIRYNPNDKNTVGFSYGRRINRPTYQDLNPFEYIYDNYSRERGNPYLLPEFSHNVELSYSYRGALNAGIGYSHTTNSFQSISSQNGEITEATNYNIGKEKRYYLNLGLGMPITKWWDSYTNLNPNYRIYEGEIPAGKLNTRAWGMSWYTSHTFSASHKWKFQLSSWGNIATQEAMASTAWLGSVNAGASKTILNDKINLRLSITDIFNTQRWKQEVNVGNVNYNYIRKWESRNIRLQLTWKFGKTTYQARDRELGAQEENNRIK
ncbi:MAG: TonB-dependent receptor [Bacteroidetes bacterium]|nr:TonB-dependent receptor [Bacteroidota bacterium]